LRLPIATPPGDSNLDLDPDILSMFKVGLSRLKFPDFLPPLGIERGLGIGCGIEFGIGGGIGVGLE